MIINRVVIRNIRPSTYRTSPRTFIIHWVRFRNGSAIPHRLHCRHGRRVAFRQLAALVAAIQTLLPELTLGRYEYFRQRAKRIPASDHAAPIRDRACCPYPTICIITNGTLNCNATHSIHNMINTNAHHTNQLTYEPTGPQSSQQATSARRCQSCVCKAHPAESTDQ